MSSYKYMYPRPDLRRNDEGQMYVNVHLLMGYHDSLSFIAEMAAELRKTFPQAKDEDIHVSKVTHSGFVKNFTLMTWSAFLSEGPYEGWHQLLREVEGAKEPQPPEYSYI